MLLRQRARARTLAVLLSVAVCGGTLNWGHVGGDDRACAPGLVQHDHSAHRIIAQTQVAASQGEHCNLCHLLRLLHTALPTESLLASNVSTIEARRAVDGALAAAILNFHVPSRAPPAAVL